jgi:hypothetical protein
MEIPNLVRERLGGESIEATVSLGDEDVIAVTPTRTILYRGDGLLSDESVSTFSHDIERLTLSHGRRNTKFSLTYVDGTKEFKVPGDRADTLLQILMQGILRVGGVAEEDESVTGVFEFSELTLVVTEKRLVKHIGTPVWDSDFEVFDYDDVNALEFEEGSVATQIVLTVNGRPQRIKAPSDQARQVEQTLTQTLCSYYDVNSIEELTAELGTDDSSGDETDPSSKELELDDGISPLVGRTDEDSATQSDEGSTTAAESPTLDQSGDTDTVDSGQSTTTEATSGAASSEQPTVDRTADRTPSQSSDTDEQGSAVDTVSTADGRTGQSDSSPPQSAGVPEMDRVDPADIDAIKDQLSTLTEAVKRQNKLLRTHNERLDANEEKIDQLIEELRQGR